MEADNPYAFYTLAGCYERGIIGMPQNFAKANELYLKAGELGCAKAYCNLGISYEHGKGVEMNKKEAKHYYELAAMKGNLNARHNLGCKDVMDGSEHRAMKHFMLAARAGHKQSLDWVKKGFVNGFATKNEYAITLRAYQQRHDEMKSKDRDKAEAYLIRQRRAAA